MISGASAPTCTSLATPTTDATSWMTEARPLRTTVELAPPKVAPTVLLVDDDPAVLDGSRTFSRGRVQVASATNGAEALSLLRGGLAAHVILLDVMMPLMDGWDFRATQLANPALREIPIVVITACRLRAGNDSPAVPRIRRLRQTARTRRVPADAQGCLPSLATVRLRHPLGHDTNLARFSKDPARRAIWPMWWLRTDMKATRTNLIIAAIATLVIAGSVGCFSGAATSGGASRSS